VGDKVKVITRVHFRTSPELREDNFLISHQRGLELEVVGGPVCYPYEDGAYLWWEVKDPNGEVGWSAEGELATKLYFFYFLKPIETEE